MLIPVRNNKVEGRGYKISNGVKSFLNNLLSIFYPKICVVCHNSLENKAIDNFLCINCWQGIKRNVPPLCIICGREIRGTAINKSICLSCQTQRFSFDRVLSPCSYEGVMRELIHKFKYQNKSYLSPFLVRLLIDFIYQQHIALDDFDLVMPIPLHKIRLREREFNQAEFLAKQIAREFSLSLSSTNLWRKHHRQAQMELSEEKRWDNIKGCFALHDPEEVKGKNVLLIDDVITTGATCQEAASMLKAAGVGIVFVLTLAN